MKFIVFQCSKSPDYFVVTDNEHIADVKGSLCPGGGELKHVGEYGEMGAERAAFDETLAKAAIAKKGYYRFEAPSMAAVPTSPEMRIGESLQIFARLGRHFLGWQVFVISVKL